MKYVLILGAGLSTPALFDYLDKHAKELDMSLLIADRDVEQAQKQANLLSHAEALALDLSQPEQVQILIKKSVLVVSMLPAFLHIDIARYCLEQKRHLITASYLSDEMRSLHEAARAK